MDDAARQLIIRFAEEHQYDEDENASFVIPDEAADDPELRAVAALVAVFGWYGEVSINPSTVLRLVTLVRDAGEGRPVYPPEFNRGQADLDLPLRRVPGGITYGIELPPVPVRSRDDV